LQKLNKMRNVLLFVILTGIILSCKNNAENKTQIIQQIKTYEKSLYNEQQMQINETVADSLILVYSDYANTFSSDTACAEYLFRAAEISKALNKGKQSVAFYEKIEKNYPSFSKLPICIFMQGFVYENLLLNVEMAKENYERFISKYPNHPLVKDTRVLIENLGKSPEDLVKQFEEKNTNTH